MSLLLLIRCDRPGCEAEAFAIWPHGHHALRRVGWHIPAGRCTPVHCPTHARRTG